MTIPGRGPEELLSDELEETRAKIAEVEIDNRALAQRVGAKSFGAPPRRLAPREHGPTGAYRAEDRGVRLERELAEANELLANLRIENAILRSRMAPVKTPWEAWIRPVVLSLVLALGGTFLWLVTENLGMLLLAAVLTGVCWGATLLIDRIRPDGSNTRTPPNLPSIGGP
jgi:hypothetical protein